MQHTATIPFRKMHGCGNDFVIVNERASTDLVQRMSNRHTGIGCDQFIVLSRSDPSVDVVMTIFNADGSVSGACGNATRCVAKILFDENPSPIKRIQTARGVLICKQRGDLIEVDMGPPRLDARELNFEGLQATTLDMGNPHCVFFIPDVSSYAVHVHGPMVETDPAFPQKTNVEFVQIQDRNHVIQRTWERGVGETLACGSGACATVVAGVLRGLTDRQVTVELKGGMLGIEWRESDDHVLMTGPAEHVFSGEFPL